MPITCFPRCPIAFPIRFPDDETIFVPQGILLGGLNNKKHFLISIYKRILYRFSRVMGMSLLRTTPVWWVREVSSCPR